MNSMLLRSLAALVLFGLAGQANAVPLVSNGSFESPVVGVGSFTSYPVGGAGLTGWNVIGPSGKEVSIVSGSFSQAGVTFPAQDGVQWLDLTGFNDNSTEGVSQSIATTAGDQYQLSFWVGNTTGGGIFGSTSTVNVLLNGNAFYSAVNSQLSPTTLIWQQFTQTFVATGASTTLGFVNGDPGSDNSNALDNIVLTDLGPGTTISEVPEPSTFVLIGAGLIGLASRRRKRKPSQLR